MLKLTLALLLLGVEGQYRSRRNRVIDGNPQPPRGLPRRLNVTSGNGTNATAAPTTAAPTTDAPTTAAPTTVAATQAATEAATQAATEAATQAATDAATQAATEAPTTVAATTAAAAGNGTNVTAIPVASVKTEVSMTVTLDLDGMSTNQKTAVGNSFAYGIHAATCNGVTAMWNTLGQCMMGIGKMEGITFGMVMNIDAKLATGSQPGCNSATDCYGGSTVAPARRMAAEELTNSGEFEVTATGADVIAQAEVAQTALKAAESSGTFSAANIATEVETAMARPAMATTLGNLTATIVKAAQEATVSVTVKEVTGATPPPAAGSTSDAYTAGVTGVFALVFGALLF